MAVEKYYQIIHNLLERHWAVLENQIVFELFSHHRGQIDGRIVLLDGSFIDLFEEVRVSDNVITKSRYSYQYVKDAQVFRYDNYSRHSGIFSPFHHKHTTQAVVQLTEPPKLIDVIEEAVRFLF